MSYSHSDKEFARMLSRDLIEMGADVWFDEGEIRLGDSLIKSNYSGASRGMGGLPWKVRTKDSKRSADCLRKVER